jgi:thiamine biosynthesis lipoprotein
MQPDRRAFLGMTAAAAVAWPLGARAEAAGLEVLEGRAFGTVWRVVAPGLSGLRSPLEAVLARVDAQMSPWRAESEVARLNGGAAGLWPVSEATAEVTRAALGLARESGGAFDPTVGPLVARWGFGPIEGELAGWSALSVGPGGIEKASDGVTLDLCGIAKGWALDRMADVLADAGVGDALIDLGGELRALGRHPGGRRWQVAVEDPRAPAPTPGRPRPPPRKAPWPSHPPSWHPLP